jgi:hypothetical protein
MAIFNYILTMLGMVSMMVIMADAVAIIVTLIIGLSTKNYKPLKVSAIVLGVAAGTYALTLALFAIGTTMAA